MHDICDLCRWPALEPAYQPADSGRAIIVHLCTHCGLVQSLPRADRAPRRAAAVSAGADWGNVRYGKGFRAEACFNLIRAHADLSKPLAALDVGSNRGSFARLFLSAARQAELICVEPDERVAQSVADLARAKLTAARIEEMQFADAQFDVVHSCHTIEHLASPARVLDAHWRALKPGGLLVVDAPNIALIGSTDILEEWFIDKHLYHFSRATLTRLIEAAGFEIVEGPDETDRENLLIAARKRDFAARPVALDTREVERAEFLISNYTANRACNLAVLTHAAAELSRLAPKGVALWGAGRLFDALVTHGRFNPRLLSLLIDTHLKNHMAERHGVALSGPEALGEKKPGVIVVMSRAFAGEIERAARAHVPDAEIVLYGDLIHRAQSAAA